MPGVCGLAFVGALALVMLLANGPALQAAPVTFAFEATVDSISPGASFDSAIDIAEGDVITGQFTFEPNAGDGSASLVVDQPYSFTVNINGIELSTAAYRATVSNDTGADLDCADFLCPGFVVIDSLTLGGSNLMEVGDDTLPNLDTDSSGFQMQLEEWFGHPFWGGTDILDTASIPAGLDSWNQFSRRPLRVWLGDGQGGTFSLNATVGQFAVVPEPSSGSLICLCILVTGIAARTGRRFQKQRQSFFSKGL